MPMICLNLVAEIRRMYPSEDGAYLGFKRKKTDEIIK
jgi:hypothetical protein